MLRSSSAHLSTLTRDPTGLLVQQAGPSLGLPPGAGRAGTLGMAAVGGGGGTAGNWTDVLIDGFQPPEVCGDDCHKFVDVCWWGVGGAVVWCFHFSFSRRGVEI